MSEKRKRLIIVIEEDGSQDGKSFNVYLDGDKERIGMIPDKDLSPAEWWGGRLFQVCVDSMRASGCVQNEQDRTKPQ